MLCVRAHTRSRAMSEELWRSQLVREVPSCQAVESHLGETPAQTVTREALEECGLIILPSSELGRAVELVHSPAEQRYFEKRCIFLCAIVEGVAGIPSDADHQVTWLPPAVAITRMAHRSHAWAVQLWVNS